MRDQHVGLIDDEADGCEIVQHVVTQLGINRRTARQRSRSIQQRMAVRHCTHHRFGADVAAGARTVDHQHMLFPGRGHVFGDGAGDDVGGTAGRKRDHHRNGFLGINLRAGVRAKQ